MKKPVYPKKAPVTNPDRRSLLPDEKILGVRCAVVLEMSVITSARLDELDRLQEILQLSAHHAQELCRKAGLEAFFRGGEIRPVKHEELVALIPRKVHKKHDGEWLCDTAHVSMKNLTDDDSKVTCKLCLKKMGEDGH